MYHSANVRQGPGSIELPRSRAPVVKADALLYVHFERPDLNQARDYLVDFGLLVVSQSEGELFLRAQNLTSIASVTARRPASSASGCPFPRPRASRRWRGCRAVPSKPLTGRAAALSSAWSTRWG